MWSDIYEFLAKGGILMVPILAGSVIALCFFLERIWALRRKRVIPQRFVERVKALVRQGDRGTAKVLCQETDSPMAHVMEAALSFRGPIEGLRSAVQEKGRHEAARLDRFVEVLGVIAAIEPLLGLLGTVKGMIEVFHNVSKKATEAGVDVGLLATGIWEALITTAFGLAIAIPVYVAYKYLISRADHMVLEMEERSVELVEVLEGVEEKQCVHPPRKSINRPPDKQQDAGAGDDTERSPKHEKPGEMDGQMEGEMDGQMDGEMDGKTDGQMDGQMERE
jgi:biopolymer transport protein ExbB